MPIYEYQCQSCAGELERIQKISDPPLLDCPKCGKAELRRKISAPVFRLKGGGWYETDFKDGKKKNLAGDSAASGDASAGNAAKSGAGDSKGSDSKSGESKGSTEAASTPKTSTKESGAAAGA